MCDEYYFEKEVAKMLDDGISIDEAIYKIRAHHGFGVNKEVQILESISNVNNVEQDLYYHD